MDYNRVQSYIKAHVLPKLDSLPDDVASVKQAFDAWKADWTQARAVKLDNLDATISSRASSQAVDGVRGGVDTTLTKLATLEGSVARLQDGLTSVETGLAGVQGDVGAVQKLAKYPQEQALFSKGVPINVTGSGFILGLRFKDINVNHGDPGEVINIKFDGSDYKGDGRNNVISWFSKKCARVTDTKLNLRFAYIDEAAGHTESFSFPPSLDFATWESFLYLKSKSLSLGAQAAFYGSEPARFDTGFSFDRPVDVLYTLDQT